MFVLCQSCNTEVEPGVDRTTLDKKEVTDKTMALCPECLKEIKLSSYMLKSLVSMGQFYEKPRAEQAFSFACGACNKTEPAVLSKDKQSAFCGNCEEKLNISPYMIKAMGIART